MSINKGYEMNLMNTYKVVIDYTSTYKYSNSEVTPDKLSTSIVVMADDEQDAQMFSKLSLVNAESKSFFITDIHIVKLEMIEAGLYEYTREGA